MDLNQIPITKLKNIGEARAKLFARVGVRTVRDLLWYLPRDYEDWSRPVRFDEAPENAAVCVRAQVVLPPVTQRVRGGTVLTRVSVSDGATAARLIFFNNPYIPKQLLLGETYLFRGRVEQNGDHPEMKAPVFFREEYCSPYRAVYPLTAGLSSKVVALAVGAALEAYGNVVPDPLPEALRQRYRLPGAAETLRMIHFPEREEEIRAAKRRLTYEELLILQLGLLKRAEGADLPPAIPIPAGAQERFIARLPFAMTGAQRRAVAECMADMGSSRPMRRLLQGDVGSGKTAVAAALIAAVAAAGCQSVLMAPTEVLARQHYNTMAAFFAGTQVRVGVLTGSTTAAARRSLLAALEAGALDLLVGTHAVLGDGVNFARLALAITDEQHRFGVMQRAALREKGVSPHVLVMSATPIPRTLSLIIYGDLSISVLDEMPAGRTPVETFVVTSDYRARIHAFLKKQMDAGRQAFLVCPLALEKEKEEAEEAFFPLFSDSEPEKTPRRSAEGCYLELKDTAFRGYPIALLHGKMKPKEKDAVMRDFAAGKTRLLISTTVIEVGVDVPNATVIVIENAECFGLSQLHQLRGRVGRGKDKSYCVLISDAKGETARRRLGMMKATTDGFAIAEEDLKLRGPGDFFGERQSGLPALRAAAMLSDARVLYAAAEDAKRLLAGDPRLEAPEHRLLGKNVTNLFADIS